LFGPHEFFHVCDSVATLAFFMFVFRYVIHYQAPASELVPTNPTRPQNDRPSSSVNISLPNPRSGIRL